MERKAAVIRREIVSSKKQAFQHFLKNLDYRKDTSKVHKFISTLNENAI
jgi:putative hemolysin